MRRTGPGDRRRPPLLHGATGPRALTAAPTPAPAGEVTTLEGIVERITYVNEESAWSVVKVAVPGSREPVTVVGNLLGVQPGESLRLEGRWTIDKRWGEQFRAASYQTVFPATLVGIERYLGSGLVRGVGHALARRLVAHFGLATLEVIDRSAERLREVEGIGPLRSARIAEAWVEQRQVREVMLFLQSHGVSTTFAVRIYKQYRERAIAIVRDNPYRLALDIFGIGFKTADAIARRLGVPRDSPERAQAGVLHVLAEATERGHVYLPRRELATEATALLAAEPATGEADATAAEPEAIAQAVAALGERVATAIESLADAGAVEIEALTAASAVETEPQAVYLKALALAERGTAEGLRALCAPGPRRLPFDVDAALADFEARQGITLAPEQREAIRRVVDSRLLVVTGGPGTGKTTLVNGALQLLEQRGRRIALAAPTGRAAKRLSEATGRPAKTLHRLLEIDPQTMRFQRDRDRPLDADLVVVDEASMLDQLLAYSLVKALPATCQLVLVGDVDQLPSVGPGSVLADLIASGVADVVRLTHIFRQGEASWIVVNAHRVNRGEMPREPRHGERADFYFIERNEPEEILSTVEHLVTERIPQRLGLDPLADVQVLTPMHRGLLGASHLNAELQRLLNPSGESLAHGARLFRVGDKVMQIRNNYELDVFNGDIGRIAAVDAVEQQATVRYEGRDVTYAAADLDELVLAYACSIHKAQGSEFPGVVVPIHTQHYQLLQRNLLYTAITRGRRLVVVVGSRRALAIAVRNAHVEPRYTRLAERLREPARIVDRGAPRPLTEP